jgi:site-specific recombinase XerD
MIIQFKKETEMNNQLFSGQAFLQHLYTGPLVPHLDAFGTVLSWQGYSRWTVKTKIRAISKLSAWLEKQHLVIDDLNESCINKFVRYREKRNLLRSGDQFALKQFITFLREEDILSAFVPEIKVSEIQCIENSFAQYLHQERGLSQATIDNYLPTIRRFLSERFHKRKVIFEELYAHDISKFVLRYAHTMSSGRAQTMVNALRSFFRFLRRRGEIAIDLAATVPTVAKWQFSEIPKYLQSEQVKHILESCDRSTETGKRNYAILLLMSRLGLRAGEIVHMELDDILWEAGEIIVRGKNSRQEKLPLPHDVGQAIATYLRDVRPHCSSRRLFIKMVAPLRGFSSSVTVCTIVRDALARADINTDFKGAHLFRHTLATNMLRGGATITEIAEILRHQNPNATEIYAKVDFASLRTIVQPWPGGAK